jgi:hypothetical protein
MNDEMILRWKVNWNEIEFDWDLVKEMRFLGEEVTKIKEFKNKCKNANKVEKNSKYAKKNESNDYAMKNVQRKSFYEFLCKS